MNYKKQTVLFGILLVAVVAGNVSRFGAKGSSHTAPVISDVPPVASRYHSRNRTTQTFERVAVTTEGRYLADRYHGRNRTTQFFGLPAGPTSIGQKTHSLNHEAKSTRDLDMQLASRYHLRTRTASFFERATGLA